MALYEKGDFRQPVKPNKKRRALCNNYSEPGTYLVTVTVEGWAPLFGTLKGGENPYVEFSDLGRILCEKTLPGISAVFPMVSVWTFCIMPDHLHMILRISEKLPEGKHLGHVIGGFKGACSRAWWSLRNISEPAARKPIFEEGYNDGILMNPGQIDAWKAYIRDNPRRLAVKRANPDLFKIWRKVTIGQRECQMIGNIFLLDVPEIMAVVVHRADDDEAFARKKAAWLACARRGGVLVSAAIAQREKLVMREAMNRGHRLILLRENGFDKYYKPAGASFDACAQGRLLQICPWDYHYDRRPIKRSQCLELNALAIAISNGR